MKKLTILYILLVLGIAFTSCERDTSSQDTSKITYFVNFELEDVETFPYILNRYFTILDVGTVYTEPGYTATEGDNDVTADVRVVGDADGSTIGYYAINYSATNVDGFDASIKREVLVYDPADFAPDELEGTYAGIRENKGKGASVEIKKVKEGLYYVSDWLVGYYEVVAGYGVAYSAPGFFQLNTDNTIRWIWGFVPGWGEWVKPVDGVYDPVAKKFTYTAQFETGFSFPASLTLNQ